MIPRRRIVFSIIIGLFLAFWSMGQQQVNGNEYVLYAYVPSPQYVMMPPSAPFMMAIPPTPIVSAQQICASQIGWQWRSEGFAMCFRPGNVPCPNGYPWMRRATERYTVCVSMDNPSYLLPGSPIN